MFWKRTLSAVILIPAIILIIHWGSFLYSTLIFCVVFLMLVEFCQLSRTIGTKGHYFAIISSGLLFCLSAKFNLPVEIALTCALFIAFVDQIFGGRVEGAFFSVASTLTGAIYIGWAFGYHLILVREISTAAGKSIGRELIFFLLVIIWCGDTAAYLFGKRFGKHKLNPQISPGKTVEGTIAGVCFATLGGLAIWFVLLRETLSLTHVSILGILLGGVSQLSDLSESIIKRNAGVKDSGTLIPGHGGLLDRCDSLIFSAPALYYYLRYLMTL